MNRVNDHTLLDDMLRHQALPLPMVKQAAREILDLIREGLIRDGAVSVSNFGSFRLKPVASRIGINPQTRERINIAAHQRVIFTPCKALRELIEPNHQAPIPIQPAGIQVQEVAHMAMSPVVLAAAELKPTPESQSNSLTEAAAPHLLLERPDECSAVAQSINIEKVETSEPEPMELDLGRLEHDNSKRYYTLAAAVAVIVILTAAALLVDSEGETGLPPETSVAEMQMPVMTASAVSVSDELSSARELDGNPVTQKPAMMNETAGAVVQEGLKSSEYFSEKIHEITHGENLWRLARSHYQQPLLWPHIYQANKEIIADPDHVREGAIIVIPALQGSPAALTKEDRFNVAEGYYLAYLHYKQQGRAEALFALLVAKRYDEGIVERHKSHIQLSQAGHILLKQVW